MLYTISGWIWQVEWFLQIWNDHFCSNLQIKRGTVQPCHFSEKNIGWLKNFCRALSTDQLLHLQPSSSSSSAGEKLTWFWIQCFMIVYLWVICVCFQSNPYSKPIRVEHIWTSWGLQRIQENQGLWGLSGKGRFHEKKVAVLLDFVQMRGGGPCPNFLFTFHKLYIGSILGWGGGRPIFFWHIGV